MSSHATLHATLSGSGPTIVLLHGYLSSLQYFKHIVPILEKEYRIVSLDLLGYGQSPKPRVDYTYEDQLRAINATLEELGVTAPFILLGHSMGALIALRYATVYGGDISKLLLFNPPLFTDVNQMIATHKAAGRRYRSMMYSRGRGLYWKALKLVPRSGSEKRSAINFTDTVRMSKHAREGSYKHIIGGAEVFSDLRKVTMPVLLVSGRYDHAVYLENLADKELPANVQLEILETGHHPLVKNLELSESLIRQHIERSI